VGFPGVALRRLGLSWVVADAIAVGDETFVTDPAGIFHDVLLSLRLGGTTLPVWLRPALLSTGLLVGFPLFFGPIVWLFS
jgi:hypothetical protein